jgi:hypothetical protein
MATMIYGHGSDDVGNFSFVPKLPYVSPYNVSFPIALGTPDSKHLPCLPAAPQAARSIPTPSVTRGSSA